RVAARCGASRGGTLVVEPAVHLAVDTNAPRHPRHPGQLVPPLPPRVSLLSQPPPAAPRSCHGEFRHGIPVDRLLVLHVVRMAGGTQGARSKEASLTSE